MDEPIEKRRGGAFREYDGVGIQARPSIDLPRPPLKVYGRYKGILRECLDTVLWTQFSRGDQMSMSPLDFPTAKSNESGRDCERSEE
jgi:hypothetical protein